MVEVTGASCRSCNGCYSKSKNESNGKPVYISQRAKTVTIANSPENDYWHVKIVNQIMYESMDVDGLQGKYESLDDDSIATVNCTNSCRRPEVVEKFSNAAQCLGALNRGVKLFRAHLGVDFAV